MINGSRTDKSQRDEWRTPAPIVRYAASMAGTFDHDTACTRENAVAAPNWLDWPAGSGALSRFWEGTCWCNPPYSDIPEWVDHALTSAKARTVMLIPSPNGERVYDRLLRGGRVQQTHIIGRVSFIGPDGKPRSGNPRGSSLFWIGFSTPMPPVVDLVSIAIMHGNLKETFTRENQ